jgi:hypothetical protein
LAPGDSSIDDAEGVDVEGKNGAGERGGSPPVLDMKENAEVDNDMLLEKEDAPIVGSSGVPMTLLEGVLG